MSLSSILMDISGSVYMENQNPKWLQLFECSEILMSLHQEDSLNPYWIRLIENNAFSGNLRVLFELIASKCGQVVAFSHSLSEVEFNNHHKKALRHCCIALRVGSLVLNAIYGAVLKDQVLFMLRHLSVVCLLIFRL